LSGPGRCWPSGGGCTGPAGAEARDRLREALAGFERLAATPWAVQARNELRAAGARRRSAHDESLTPQELRVVAAVARGASNREIAAELFLAPKTVEFHLGQIYRKLGVRSRAQLAATLPREAEPPTNPGPWERRERHSRVLAVSSTLERNGELHRGGHNLK